MDEQKNENDEFIERMQEIALHLYQPLLDYGWRVDYQRMGITCPGRFIPLADLRKAAEMLNLSSSPAKPYQGPWMICREVTPQEAAAFAEAPADELLTPDCLDFLRQEGLSVEDVRQAIREGTLSVKHEERFLPLAA